MFQCRRRTRLQAFRWRALQHHIFDAARFAETTFFLGGTIFIHHKNVGFYFVHSAHKVHHAVAIVDKSVFHITDGFHHEEAFLFRVKGLMVFVVKDGLVGADAYIKVAILCRLAEKLHMSTMQEVVTS